MVVAPGVTVVLCTLILGVCARLPFVVTEPSTQIPKGGLHEFISSKELALILFYTTETQAPTIDSSEGSFSSLVNVMAESSGHMHVHDIHFGVYDCTEDRAEEACNRKTGGTTLSIYVRNVYLTEMPSSSFYSPAAVMANTLQMLLLNEVPLLETAEELKSLMKNAVAKDENVLLMSVPSLGVPDHSEFLQIAKVSLDHIKGLKFAHTTNQKLVPESQLLKFPALLAELGISERPSQLYFLQCKGVTMKKEITCPAYPYTNRMEQARMNDFISVIQHEGMALSNAMEFNLPVVVCYYQTLAEEESLMILAQKISEEFKGSFLFYRKNRGTAERHTWLDKSHQEKIKNTIEPTCFLKQDQLAVVVPAEHLKRVIVKSLVVINREQENSESSRFPSLSREEEQLDALIQEVETQDETVAILDDMQGGKKLKFSHAKVLTRDTFSSDKYSGVVLFHVANLDAYSRVIARLFDEAAGQDNSLNMAVMSCYDWTDVCKRLGITTYPTVISFKDGSMRAFSGVMNVTSFVKLAKVSFVDCPQKTDSLLQAAKARKFLQETGYLSVIGLFKSTKDREYKTFVKVAEQLCGQEIMSVVTDEFAEKMRKQFSIDNLPTVIAYNPSAEQPVRVFEQRYLTTSSLREFTLRASLPRFAELNAETMPRLFDSRKFRLIFASETNEGSSFTSLLALSEDKDVMNKFVFTYMLMNTKDNREILATMAPEANQIPVLMVVQPKSGHVYLFEGTLNADQAAIKTWLLTISLGNVAPSNTLPVGEWLPSHPGYDFLAMIDKDKNKQEAAHDRFHQLRNDDPLPALNAPPPSAAAEETSSDWSKQAASTDVNPAANAVAYGDDHRPTDEL